MYLIIGGVRHFPKNELAVYNKTVYADYKHEVPLICLI